MTLEKAIEILKDSINCAYGDQDLDLRTATKLGSEAIRRIRTLRAEPHLQAAALLPSETEF